MSALDFGGLFVALSNLSLIAYGILLPNSGILELFK